MQKLTENEPIEVFPIAQATTAVFPDLYFRKTILFFIESGSKRVLDVNDNEIIAETGDLLVLPPASMVTMENRPITESSYRALGIAYSNETVRTVFTEPGKKPDSVIQVLQSSRYDSTSLVPLLKQTYQQHDLPDPLRTHRLLEPLVWLKYHGFNTPVPVDESILSQARKIIEEDISQPWTSAVVANRLAMSESTMRRRLATYNQGFARLLLNTRLEMSLSLLQTTSSGISEIAYNCGFKSPSHFADAFKKRFGIQPKKIRTDGTQR